MKFLIKFTGGYSSEKEPAFLSFFLDLLLPFTNPAAGVLLLKQLVKDCIGHLLFLLM